jgi:hypothetical protein
LEAHRVERKLAAIFAADVEGYSRLMGLDEVGTLRTLTAYRVIIDRLIASHRGRIFNTAGDSVLADFASAVDAVQCAVEVQDAIAKENADRGEQAGFELVWGFSCQVVVFGLLPVLCSEREGGSSSRRLRSGSRRDDDLRQAGRAVGRRADPTLHGPQAPQPARPRAPVRGAGQALLRHDESRSGSSIRPATSNHGPRACAVIDVLQPFALDSPVEGAVSSEPVSALKFPVSRENTGNFIGFGVGLANL